MCQVGYYRLTQGNPQGCIACACHLEGTINRSSVCQGDYYGQCNCKTNVELRNCSRCKDGYYDLQDAHISGCKSCGCDVGATRSGEKCDKETGFCHCYPHVTGRTCNRTEIGFYYPDVHYIHAARSPYVRSAMNTLHVLLNIPRTGNYRMLIKYTNNGLQVQANTAIKYKNASRPLAGELFNSSITLSSSCVSCRRVINDRLFLKKGAWNVNITTTRPANQQLELESVVAIPVEFKEATVLGDQRGNYQFLCSIDGNKMTSLPSCLLWFFSVSMDYLRGALDCYCHPLGSNSSVCESYGGQCPCKPGVEGRDCSRCKPGFYNLTATGCTPCGCNGANYICDVTTGMCECPENTVGRTCQPCQCNNNTNKCLRSGECIDCQYNTTGYFCQHCANGTFGNALNQQCNACACNEVGSLDQQCHRVSGQCNCNNKVMGRDCSQCQNNTFDLGPAGCRDCECNPLGSVSLQCYSSGQCPCQTNVTGFKCTQCSLGFYGLPIMSCRECNCSTVGSIPGTLCINDTAGQCQCKTGVTGRSCDQCKKYFTNFSDSGCSECSPCIRNLRQTIVNTTDDANRTEMEIQALKDLTYFNAPLAETSTLLEQAKVERERFYSRTTSGNQAFQELVSAKIPKTNESLLELSIRASNLSNFSNTAANNTTDILEEVKEGKQRTISARDNVSVVNELVRDVLAAINEHFAAASQDLTDSAEVLSLTRERNFSQYTMNITNITYLAENASTYAKETLKKVFSQLFLAHELCASVEIRAANFTEIQAAWNQSHTQFLNTMEQVYNHSHEIQAILMETKRIMDEELLTLNRTESSLLKTNVTLINAWNVLKEGTLLLEQYRHTILFVSGELEISMLRYELERTKFVVRVMKGRNLPARDSPAQTSDPYVVISAIPDWNNEGTMRTSPVNGNLNPEFPFKLFSFTIPMEQLNYTKVRLAVYDHDPGDEDDFLGVVFIDLATAGDFFNSVITKWYPLLPQDLSQIDSGNFVSSSGLTDVSNVLEKEIRKMQMRLGVSDISLQQAQNQASYLESLAYQMELTFNSSRAHGSLPLLAIDRYSEIAELVNRSLDLVELANITVSSITKKLSVISLADLKHNAEMAWSSLRDLYNVTLERNATAHGLEKDIYEANTTFLNSLALWDEIYDKFPVIQNAAVRLQASASGAPDVIPFLMDARNEVQNARVMLTGLELHLSNMQQLIDLLLLKTTAIKSNSDNGIMMMNKALVNVQNITTRLTPNPDEPPVNVTVREATAVMTSLPPLRQQIENQMENASNKLNQIRRMVASIPLALHLTNDSSITFVPSRRTIESPSINEISFDIKTNISDGILLYVVGEQDIEPNERSNELTNSLGFYISNSLVHAVFNLGGGPTVAQNSLELKNDTWYNIYFTRFGAEAFLTVSGDSERRETVRVNGSSNSEDGKLKLTNQSVIYVGGLPADLKESQQVSNYFKGIIDNLIIDSIRYNLWNPKQAYGDGRLYAVSRHRSPFYPQNGKAISFHGNGYIQHALGPFNNSMGYTEVEVEFTTLHQNGIIMAVSNKQQKYVFVIYLQHGRVYFYFQTGQSDAGITLESVRSSYGDGRWYRVRVIRTSVNATLALNLVGSRETPDGRFVDNGIAAFESGHEITFGDLQPNRPNSDRPFSTTDRFSGDMNNLRLFSEETASLISRTFNDAALMTAKQGVSFSGVIKGPIEHGTRFYGYREEVEECSHANIDIGSETGDMTSLTFTFKTREESGVLLYSENDDSPTLYLTLLHGDLLLWLGDLKSPAVFSSSNITFSDNSWYVLRLTAVENRYLLYVNDTFLYSGVWNVPGSTLTLRKPFYMGGVPRNMSVYVPFALCFQGGMKDLVINSRNVSFFSGRTIGVSSAGVIPARVPPPVPKTCSASLDPSTSSNNPKTVHFGLLESKRQSYIGFNLTGERNAVFSSDFVVGLYFRALSYDGLLLYGTDNDTHPTQFFSLELVRGRLVYKFDSGRGLVSITTKDKYSGKGVWYRVYILRWFHFGAILVNLREYTNGRHVPPSNAMNLTRLYIGGLPSHVFAPHLTNRYLGFVGCMGDMEVKGNAALFDITNFDIKGPDKSSDSCYDVAQPGLGFNGSAWARFENITLGENFSVELTFRTSTRDGLLFVILGNSTTEAGNQMKARLEQSSGQIIFTYIATINESRVVWTEPGLGNNSQSSYLMCQMDWHTVRVRKHGRNITINMDDGHYASGTVLDGTSINGKLFLGGFPATTSGENNTVWTGFQGCVKSFSVDGENLHFARAADASHVSLACPLNNKEKESIVDSQQ